MKILILSRFDIFHLMSTEARASLQRSALGNARESIEARALKSMAWEKYKKKFFSELQQAPKASGQGQSLRSPEKLYSSCTELSKSVSAPVLSSAKSSSHSLVDPGIFMLVCRRDLQPDQIGPKSPLTSSKHRGRLGQTAPSVTDDAEHSQLQIPDDSEQSSEATPAPEEAGSETEAKQTTTSATSLDRSASMPVLDKVLVRKLLSPNEAGSENGRVKVSASRSPSIRGQSRVPHALSAPNVITEAIDAEEKESLPSVTVPSSKALAPPRNRGGYRRLSNQRSDKSDSSIHLTKGTVSSVGKIDRAAVPLAATPTIWDPVHGVCQPFSVVGFMKEPVAIRPVSTFSDVKPSKTVKPTTASDRRNASELTRGGSSGIVPTPSPPRPPPVEITRFRVFGKLRDVSDAMDLFRRVCAVESSAAVCDSADCSRFVIYKEAEMTMVLENFPSVALADGAVVRQFGASDLPQGNAQRFACVGVMIASDVGPVPLSTVESVAIHVYQCFPTPQSAVRFARHASASLLSAVPTYIVPLFEWIPLSEIERFDARNTDLEQALEQVMLLRGGATHTSTWKARKDAMKRSGVHLHARPRGQLQHHQPELKDSPDSANE